MKRITTGIICILFAAACQQSQNGASAGLTGYTLHPIPGSSWQRATKTDGERLIEEGFVEEGKKTGTWVTYHDDARNYPKTIASYAGGALEGPYMEVNNFGQYELVAQYSQNEMHGRVAKYHLTRLVEEMYYKNGVPDGPYTLYFPNSDIKQRTAGFKNGVEDGITRFYNEQGRITMEYEYRDGEKIRGGIVKDTVR